MRKKTLALVLSLALIAVAVVGGTMAYFTDKDAQTNTFTVGNVKIDLFEDFGDNDGIESLVPATGSAVDNTLKNAVEKEVYVKNIGSEDAYVRVHIAVPAILDSGDTAKGIAQKTLHLSTNADSLGNGHWNWGTQAGATEGSYLKNGDRWNYYTITIGNIQYNVYVITYETAIKRADVTKDAMSQVYLDSETTQEQITAIKEVLGDRWHIYVVAQGVQAAGFDDAYTALNTAFTANPTAGDFLNEGHNLHFKDM